MPPKKNTKTGSEEEETEDLASLLKEVISSQRRMEKNQNSMQDQLNTLLVGFDKIKTGLSAAERDIVNLQKKTNMIEQHSRNFTVRVFNLKIQPDSAKDCVKTSNLVYRELIQPILQLAVDSGELPRVPDLLDTVEYSHILPAKGNKEDAIIVRFQSRILRALIFKYKSKYYKAHPEAKSSIFEDLTVPNFKLLKSLQEDVTVHRAWSTGGKVKYVLKSNQNQVLSADPFSHNLSTSA